MAGHELAQFNVARALEPIDHPVLGGFAESLEPVNRLADEAPGVVWRLADEAGTSIGYRVDSIDSDDDDDDDDQMLINLSVWSDVDALRTFTYDGAHRDVFRKRRAWFEAAVNRQLVLWWVPIGHRPSLEEAADRLDRLREHGPTAEAFTFATPFPPPHA